MSQSPPDTKKELQQNYLQKTIKNPPQKCFSSLEKKEGQQPIIKNNNSYLKLTESNLEAMLRKSPRFMRNSSSFSVLSQKSSSRQLQKSIEQANAKNNNRKSRQAFYTQQNQSRLNQPIYEENTNIQTQQNKMNVQKNIFNQQSRGSQQARQSKLNKYQQQNQIASSMSIKYPSNTSQNPQTPSLQVRSKPNKMPLNQFQLIDLQLLDQQIQNLINRKLSLLAELQKHNQNFSHSMISLQVTQIDNELRKLINTLKISHSKKDTNQKDSFFLSKKIELIQNLLAQNAAEGHLMRKFFANSVSMKGPIKHSSLGKHQIANMVNSFNKFQKSYISDKIKLPSTLLEPYTTNKVSFKQPNPEDYQSYRFKPKDFQPNRQPLPRSSYKRDFLKMNPQQSDKIFEKKAFSDCKVKYHNLKSSYNQDFQKLKSESVDYKDLDAYRDKFKFIKFSYMPKHAAQITERKKQLTNQSINEIKYIKKLQSSIKSALKTPEKQIKYAQMVSQSKRSFVWQNNNNIDRSKMKHKNLKQFEYRLKNMYKA